MSGRVLTADARLGDGEESPVCRWQRSMCVDPIAAARRRNGAFAETRAVQRE
jgi:hypothetical protein